MEEAGAPIVITWVSTREDKKEGQVALLNEEAPAVQFKALVGSRFRARKQSTGEPIIDFVVEFRDENFTVPAPPGTKLYKDTPPLPPNVEKSQASIKAGKALRGLREEIKGLAAADGQSHEHTESLRHRRPVGGVHGDDASSRWPHLACVAGRGVSRIAPRRRSFR